MGTLRTLLATVVMLGHFGNHGFYMIGGDLAVQIFYVISGFSMSIILYEQKNYESVKSFYTSRLLKLFPVYYFIAIISFIVYAFHFIVLQKQNELFKAMQLIPDEFVALAILLNLSVFLQDIATFIFFTGTDIGISGIHDKHKDVLAIDAMILPQSWTVAIELYFYILCPFIIKKIRVIIALIVASLLINAILFYFNLIDRDPWSYRFFPGQLYLFLLGIVSHQVIYKKYIKLINEQIAFSILLSVLVVLYISLNDLVQIGGRRTFNHILVNGIFLLLPAFYHVSQFFKADVFIGRMSFPVYLLHFIVFFILVRVMSRAEIHDEFITAMVSIVVTFVAALALDKLVIRHIDDFRHKLKIRTLKSMKHSD